MRLPMLALALLCATPAIAQQPASETWTTTADTVRAQAAGIALPQQAGALALVKTGEISDYGSGINSYAQYASADNVVQATAFIYKPGFADTALAAVATERAIFERFGPTTRRASQQVTDAGGHANSALRTLYTGAADGQLVLAAAFVHAGGWIVKLRVTATSDRQADVEAGVNAMLKGLSFDTPSALQRASAVDLKACAVDSKALCRLGTIKVDDATFDVLQVADANANGSVVIPIDDAGALLRFDRVAGSQGYALTRYGLDSSTAVGRYPTLPDTRQMAAIIDGSDQKLAKGDEPSTTTVLRESVR